MYTICDAADDSSQSVCFAVMSKNDAICLIEDFKNVAIIEFCENSIHMKFKNDNIYSFVFHSMEDAANARRSIFSVIVLSKNTPDDSNNILRELFLKMGPNKRRSEFISEYLETIKV